MSFDINNYPVPSPSFLKKLMGGSPAKAVYEKMNPKESTAAQEWAKALEVFVLERDHVGEYYVRFDADDRPDPEKTFRAKVNKEWRDKVQEEAGEKRLLSVEEWELLEMAHERVWKQCGNVLEMFDQSQEYIEGDLFGRKYRGYIDKSDSKTGNVLEMKAVPPRVFRRTARKDENMWDVQGAAYLLAKGGKMVYFLAVDPKPPFDAKVFYMEKGSEDMVNAVEILDNALKVFYECKEFPERWEMGLNFWSPLPERVNFGRYMEGD